MSKIYVGIDPGAKGFVAVVSEFGWRHFSIVDHSRRELAEYIEKLAKDNILEVVVAMEEVHAIFGASAKSTFEFGEIFGLLKGLIIAHNLPYHLVAPKTWQAQIWINEDKVYTYGKVNAKTGKVTKSVNTKATSLNAATRLFPGMDFRRTPSCKNVDDNKVDATLIAEYARRNNL